MPDQNAPRLAASRSGSRMMHGGFVEAEGLGPELRARVDAVIDTLIPPEEGWPAAADLGVAELMATYLVPADAPVSLYPHFGRAEFAAIMERVAAPLVGIDLEGRVEHLRRLEEAQPELFARLRDFVYYAYYGHPAVVAQIRANTRYGGDYLGGSQPAGYRGVLEAWGEKPMTTRGTFFRTDSILRMPQARNPHDQEHA